MAVNINASTTAGLGIAPDSSGAIQFQKDGTNTVVIDTSGYLGIGTSSPGSELEVASATESSQIYITGNSPAGGVGTGIYTKAKNAGSVVQTGQWPFYIGTSGWDGTGYRNMTWIASEVAATPANGSVPSVLRFYTTGIGTNLDPSLRMSIDHTGNVLLNTAGGLGYGFGSGGTVTQATSKSTAVTLNKPTGQITMSNAALAASASVTFILNNSLIVTGDMLIVSPINNANYTVQVTNAVGGGSPQASIRVTNITAGSLSEALVISFAIIKGSTA